MSGREAARLLARTNKTYVVRVVDRISEHPDLLLATHSRRRAERTLARRRREGYKAKLEIRLS